MSHPRRTEPSTELTTIQLHRRAPKWSEWAKLIQSFQPRNRQVPNLQRTTETRPVESAVSGDRMRRRKTGAFVRGRKPCQHISRHRWSNFFVESRTRKSMCVGFRSERMRRLPLPGLNIESQESTSSCQSRCTRHCLADPTETVQVVPEVVRPGPGSSAAVWHAT